MNTTLKPGYTVDIYQKPITGEGLEGSAELLELIRADEGDGLTMWEVRFISDGFVCIRTINAKNANPIRRFKSII